MITVDIIKGSGNYITVSSKGHAGYANSGKDIICAAVSSLIINTFNSIEKFTDDRFTTDVVDEKSGSLQMSFIGENSHDCHLLLDSLVLGLESIIDQYGEKYLTLHIKEV